MPGAWAEQGGETDGNGEADDQERREACRAGAGHCAPLPAPAPAPPSNRGGAHASLDASHPRAPPGICPSDPVQVSTVHPPSGDCWDGAMTTGAMDG